MSPLTLLFWVALLFSTGEAPFHTEAPSRAEAYDIDAEHAFITFKVHRFTMVDVVGFFPDISGTIHYDEADPTALSAEVIVQTGSVYTGKSDGRDQAVKSQFFLDVATYPEMTFTTKRVETKGGETVAIGDLTIHGVTNEVAIPISIKGPAQDPTGVMTLAIHGRLTINRHDYGIAFDRKLSNGEPFIGSEVEIELNVLAIKSE